MERTRVKDKGKGQGERTRGKGRMIKKEGGGGEDGLQSLMQTGSRSKLIGLLLLRLVFSVDEQEIVLLIACISR